MARDVNNVVVTGKIVRAPSMIALKSGRQVCCFGLNTVEKYTLADGTPATHDNFLEIEVFGKNADRALRDIRLHDRYQITGYLRVDEIQGEEKIRIRAFSFQRE